MKKAKTCLVKTAGMMAVILGVCTIAGAAKADRDDWHRGDDWRAHERAAHDWHAHHYYQGHVRYGYNEPYAAYAPPVIVEPPPAYYAPEYPDANADVNLVFPLNFH